ncbi:MAG: S8 family serine peptidase [Byssovorax sp.]
MSDREVQRGVTRQLGPDWTVAPLFRDFGALRGGRALRDFFVAKYDKASPSSLLVHPFDIAYALRDRLNLESVVPDLTWNLGKALLDGLCMGATLPAPADRAWSLRAMNVPEAWDANTTGQGVLIGHIDTGWAPHVDLDESRLDLTRSYNVLRDGAHDGDARDRMLDEFGKPFEFPGHGTGTASVIVSEGRVSPLGPGGEGNTTQPGFVTGVAPGATLVPIRASRSVIIWHPSDIARAILHAVEQGCHVISMSLGGPPSPAMEAALNLAVENDVIVIVAAGNCIEQVTFPARYPAAIAVGGSNQDSKPWRGSCQGRSVAISAPAENVYHAKPIDDAGNLSTSLVVPYQGTSFATAAVAGVAALWLAKFGRDELRKLYPQNRLQSVFRERLRSTAHVPAGWDTENLGAGIVDAARVVREPLSPMDGPDKPLSLSSPLDLLLSGVPFEHGERVMETLQPLLSMSAGDVESGARRSAEPPLETGGERSCCTPR